MKVLTKFLHIHRLCDSYDALPNCAGNSKQTTPTTLQNQNFGSLNDNSIYKCSSDCYSMERQPRHNHHSHSHFNNHTSSGGAGGNGNKRKQKTKHHHRTNNHQHVKHLAKLQQKESEIVPYSHQMIVGTPDSDQQNHHQIDSNYEYVADESQCGGDDDENSCNLGKVTISENEETTEHDDDEIGNSYSCDDTLTDDAILSAGGGRSTEDGVDKFKRIHHNHHNCEQTSRDSGSGGDTCCSCSDTSCVYEEPPSHPNNILINGNSSNKQALRIGDEN